MDTRTTIPSSLWGERISHLVSSDCDYDYWAGISIRWRWMMVWKYDQLQGISVRNIPNTEKHGRVSTTTDTIDGGKWRIWRAGVSFEWEQEDNRRTKTNFGITNTTTFGSLCFLQCPWSANDKKFTSINRITNFSLDCHHMDDEYRIFLYLLAKIAPNDIHHGRSQKKYVAYL